MFDVLNRDELEEWLESDKDFKLINVLGEEQFERMHIPGSINIPVVEIEERAEEELDKDETIVVYCANFDCQASPTAAKKLAEAGFERVYDYEGGLEDWQEGDNELEGTDMEELEE